MDFIEPTRTEVNKSLAKVSEYDQSINLSEMSTKVFAQYGYVKTYCIDKKLQEWTTLGRIVQTYASE